MAVAAAYRARIARLLAMRKRVILITSVPQKGWNAPRHMAFARLRSEGSSFTTARATIDARLRPSLRALIPQPAPKNLIVISPDDLLCDAAVGGRCRLSEGGNPLYADSDHSTNRGAGLIVDMVTAYLPKP